MVVLIGWAYVLLSIPIALLTLTITKGHGFHSFQEGLTTLMYLGTPLLFVIPGVGMVFNKKWGVTLAVIAGAAVFALAFAYGLIGLAEINVVVARAAFCFALVFFATVVYLLKQLSQDFGPDAETGPTGRP